MMGKQSHSGEEGFREGEKKSTVLGKVYLHFGKQPKGQDRRKEVGSHHSGGRQT